MTIARVFISGNSQAIRLPHAFRVNVSEMEIFKRGDELVLRPIQQDLSRAFELLSQLPDDFLPNGREQLPVQEREGL
jgi:antitoxin VapB